MSRQYAPSPSPQHVGDAPQPESEGPSVVRLRLLSLVSLRDNGFCNHAEFERRRILLVDEITGTSLTSTSVTSTSVNASAVNVSPRSSTLDSQSGSVRRGSDSNDVEHSKNELFMLRLSPSWTIKDGTSSPNLPNVDFSILRPEHKFSCEEELVAALASAKATMTKCAIPHCVLVNSKHLPWLGDATSKSKDKPVQYGAPLAVLTLCNPNENQVDCADKVRSRLGKPAFIPAVTANGNNTTYVTPGGASYAFATIENLARSPSLALLVSHVEHCKVDAFYPVDDNLQSGPRPGPFLQASRYASRLRSCVVASSMHNRLLRNLPARFFRVCSVLYDARGFFACEIVLGPEHTQITQTARAEWSDDGAADLYVSFLREASAPLPRLLRCMSDAMGIDLVRFLGCGSSGFVFEAVHASGDAGLTGASPSHDEGTGVTTRSKNVAFKFTFGTELCRELMQEATIVDESDRLTVGQYVVLPDERTAQHMEVEVDKSKVCIGGLLFQEVGTPATDVPNDEKVSLLVNLHLLGYYHGDPRSANIVKVGGKLKFVDMARGRKSRGVAMRQFAKRDLAILLKLDISTKEEGLLQYSAAILAGTEEEAVRAALALLDD
eukprot:TRINITY_DN6350_c0_g2_i4.p1 TRINITY_DN6350_c0_g2~~TRINITY_DN6350_c0_g2_i4.p1  ORF type:complete len:608 (+),score=47.74 TRINITY_DN6350_c0_g2_i4:158-1981(+)